MAILRHREAARLLEEQGPTVIEKPGAPTSRIVRNPLSVTVRADAEQIRTQARELGLSPSARANLAIPVQAEGLESIDDDLGPPPEPEPLTLEEVRQMSPDQINGRWDEVQALLRGDPPKPPRLIGGRSTWRS